MNIKRWLALFLGAAILAAALYAAFNMAVDPFGVFGEKLLDYGEYSMTENPRVAKMAYLEKNHEKYDSYIVGCSKTSSYPTELLNAYTGGSFFNLFAYGGDMADEEKMATYVIENYSPKNIVVALGPEAAYKYDFESDSLKDNLFWKVEDSSAFRFYLKYAFLHPSYSAQKLISYFDRSYLPSADAVFNTESGAYDKTVRDSVPIGSLADYDTVESSAFEITHSRPLDYIDECVASVKRIKQLCDERGVNFMLIASPMYAAEQACYSDSDMTRLMTALAEVSDFWDFWGYNELGSDRRYFYDGYHFRNCVGKMALAYIFGDSDVYVPEDFGHYTTAENVSERITEALTRTETDSASYTCRVPILMYHHFVEDGGDTSSALSASSFEEQLKTLSEAGFTAVTYDELISYVELGEALPEKPVVISIDDGYESNLTIAAPLLEKYGMCAVISVIGVSDGKTTYKDTGEAMTPHFSLTAPELLAYIERGVLDIQSHSYDMHMVPSRDGEDCRVGVLPLEGESEKDYISTLSEDYTHSAEQILAATGKSPCVFTYPEGKYTSLSETVLHSLGVKATVTTESGVSELVRGIPQSLYLLKRLNIYEGVTGEAILTAIEENS